MKKMSLMKGLGFGVVALALGIQLVPYGRSHSNPPSVSEPEWDRPQTRVLFARACLDCHSHETRWPWYSNVAPVSWLVQRDVDEAREHFNVSLWGTGVRNEGDEAAGMLRSGEMPPKVYLPAHPEARLSEEEKADLIRGLAATFGDRGGRGDGFEAESEDKD